MAMRTINDSLYDLLMAQGISAGRPASPTANKSAMRVGARKSRRNKGAGVSPKGDSQRVTEYPEGGLDIPMGRSGGSKRPIRIVSSIALTNPTKPCGLVRLVSAT